MPRHKEAKRVILTAHVLPKTSAAIRGKVVKGDRDGNTIGKVIDRTFKQ